MSQTGYTFGPPPGVAPATPTTEEQKKKNFSFGPPGQPPKPQQPPTQQGGGNTPPPVAAPQPTVAKPPVASAPPVATPSPAPRPAPKPSSAPVDFNTPSFLKGFVEKSGFDPAKLQAVQQMHMGDKMYNMEHPYTRMGAEMVKEASKGLGQWMSAVYDAPTVNKMASKLAEPVVAPLDSLARMLEFHTGKNWDAFGLHNAGVDETAVEEIARGFKEGKSNVMAEGAGKLAGAFGTVMMMKEAPKIAKEASALPGEIRETASIAEEARKKNQSVVTAAANNTLHNDMKSNIIPTIVQADKNVSSVIGQHVKIIADADRAASAASGTSAFTRADVATAVQDAVKDTRATTVPKPETVRVAKILGKYGKQMSWEDLKDFRSQIHGALQNAEGKDKVVLAKLNEWASNKLKSRAVQIGKGDNFTEYSDLTQKQTAYRNGPLNNLRNADTGLKLYKELAKESNKPELNDMFHLMERHGGLPSGYIDDLVKTRKPIYELAARADGGDSAGGRLGALLRHPAAAGTAMVGTGLAVSMSPVPLTGSFVASLIAAQKAANFMDRIDAVKAMRKIRGQAPPNMLRGMPTPFPGGPGTPPRPIPPPGGATPGGPSPVAPTGTPQAPTPGGPSLSPQAAYGLNRPFGGVANPTPPVATVPEVPPAVPDLQEFLSRVNANRAAMPGEKPMPEVKMPHSLAGGPDRRLSTREPNPMRQAEFDRLYKIVRDPKADGLEKAKAESKINDMKANPNDEPLKGDIKSMKAAPKKMSKEEALAEEAKRHGKTPTETEAKGEVKTEEAKETPYEKFGVKKIDKSTLTTPEAVTAAKKDAVAQIEEIARDKFKEIQQIKDTDKRQAALKQLDTDVKAANRSVQKMQTPGVSREARDRARKAETALKTVKPQGPEGSMIENLNEEEVAQKAATGMTNDEEAMMELVDLGRSLEKMNSPIINKVVQDVYKRTGGDPRTTLPQLRELLSKLQAAKKPE